MPEGMDPQYGNAQLLRPIDNFESVYQGQSTDLAIAFPGGLDDRAGSPGYAPNLQRGLKVPLGSWLLIYFPVAVLNEDAVTFATPYAYQIVFRMRNLVDYRLSRTPFHLPAQSPGVPSGGDPRVVLPACAHSVAYQQPQPAAQRNAENFVINDRIVITGNPNLPFALDAAGAATVTQQGILSDPIYGPQAIFRPRWVKAEGDDMIIYANRLDPDTPSNTWDFEAPTADQPFSNIFGTNNGQRPASETRNIGIYVLAGNTP